MNNSEKCRFSEYLGVRKQRPAGSHIKRIVFSQAGTAALCQTSDNESCSMIICGTARMVLRAVFTILPAVSINFRLTFSGYEPADMTPLRQSRLNDS